jgi:hypothetical protein
MCAVIQVGPFSKRPWLTSARVSVGRAALVRTNALPFKIQRKNADMRVTQKQTVPRGVTFLPVNLCFFWGFW